MRGMPAGIGPVGRGAAWLVAAAAGRDFGGKPGINRIGGSQMGKQTPAENGSEYVARTVDTGLRLVINSLC